MNILGEKVRIRDRIPGDSLQEIIWEMDAEIRHADPPAGKLLNSQRFSIETLEGEHIGSCSLYNWTDTDIQFGIRIGNKHYWNKGYGTDATNALVNYCFVTSGIERIWLKVLPWNTRAIKCYEKCGFTRAGWLALDGYDFALMEIRKPEIGYSGE